jgi:hypothetical protein
VFRFALLLLTLAPLPVAAQGTHDVVVTGRREPPRATARRFADAISRPVNGQLARVRWPICPLVLGVEPALAARIAERLRQVARAAGAPVAAAGCRDANSTIILSPDPAALVADMRASRPGWLTGVPAAELARLSAPGAPARAWQVTEILNEDGRAQRGSAATSGALAPTQANGDVAMPAAPVLQVMGSSILQPSMQQAISAAFVLLDARATVGRSAEQVADYAAMRLLAVTQPPESGGDTILTLFGADSAPAGLTDSDAAYLRALYHSPATERASARLDTIAGKMARRR